MLSLSTKPAAGIQRDASVNKLLQPLAQWMTQGDITEICVNRPGEVYCERETSDPAQKWVRYDCPEMDYHAAKSLGIAIAKFANKGELAEDAPIMSAVLPKGERIQVVMPPACEEGTISITIRKPSFKLRTLGDYAEQGFFKHIRPITGNLSPDELELLHLKREGDYVNFLRRAVQLEKVIVVAGETGSGKTTFMKALIQEIPQDQRIITIEDVPELFLPYHPNHVHLFYPSEAKEEENAPVTAASLLKSCLRMKPSRILLAELRSGETFDFINVAASGHGGSITSCHAGSAELTFERLALMVLQNRQGRTLPYDVIRRLLYMVVDVVVHVHNDVHGDLGRHITELWYEPELKRIKGKTTASPEAP